MKAKIVRAAAILYWYSPNRFLIVSFERHGILESVYVREGAVYSFHQKETKASPLGTDFMSYADGTGEGPSLAEGPSRRSLGPMA